MNMWLVALEAIINVAKPMLPPKQQKQIDLLFALRDIYGEASQQVAVVAERMRQEAEEGVEFNEADIAGIVSSLDLDAERMAALKAKIEGGGS